MPAGLGKWCSCYSSQHVLRRRLLSTQVVTLCDPSRACRLRNRVRVFQLPTGPDDYALMLTVDYNAALQSAAQQQLGKGTLPSLVHVFDWFRERVLPACCEVMLTHSELMRLLGGGSGR